MDSHNGDERRPHCVDCGAETQLYSHGEPVCINCVEAREKKERLRDRNRLIHDIE